MRLKAPRGLSTRPTTDRVKESVFAILTPHMPYVNRVLDLYAGSGALGIEALSRGAHSAVFVESSRDKCRIIRENLEHTGFLESARIVPSDCIRAIERFNRAGEVFELIIADPPYDTGLASRTVGVIANSSILSTPGILVVEHSSTESLPDTAGKLTRYRIAQYGRVEVSFYELHEDFPATGEEAEGK